MITVFETILQKATRIHHNVKKVLRSLFLLLCFITIGFVSFLQNKYFREVFLVIILLVGATLSVDGY